MLLRLRLLLASAGGGLLLLLILCLGAQNLVIGPACSWASVAMSHLYPAASWWGWPWWWG